MVVVVLVAIWVVEVVIEVIRCSGTVMLLLVLVLLLVSLEVM